MTMQVAVHAGQLLQPFPGGIGRYVTSLLRALPGVEVSPVPFAAGPAPASTPGWDDLGWVDLGFPRGRWRYELWHRFRRPPLPFGPEVEVVHATSLALPPPGRRPLVVTVHDLVFLDHPDCLTPRGVSFHRRGLEIARDEAAAFVVPSAWVARRLEACGVEAARIHVAHHGVDLTPPSPHLDSAPSGPIDLPPSFILFVGTIEPRKGVGDLLAALDEARRENPELHLVLAGPAGWGALPDLDAAHVHWLGSVEDATLDHLYRHALGLVLPSRDEGFGLPLIEAMARGCPVISSDAACLPEIVGDAGEVVPLGDLEALAGAIGRLSDPVRRGVLVERGFSRATDFTWHASALSHLAAYRGALANR